MRGRYGSVRDVAGHGCRVYVYNSNCGRARQGVHQRLGYNNPAHGNQIGRGGKGSQQPSKLFKDNYFS